MLKGVRYEALAPADARDWDAGGEIQVWGLRSCSGLLVSESESLRFWGWFVLAKGMCAYWTFHIS